METFTLNVNSNLELSEVQYKELLILKEGEEIYIQTTEA